MNGVFVFWSPISLSRLQDDTTWTTSMNWLYCFSINECYRSYFKLQEQDRGLVTWQLYWTFFIYWRPIQYLPFWITAWPPVCAPSCHCSLIEVYFSIWSSICLKTSCRNCVLWMVWVIHFSFVNMLWHIHVTFCLLWKRASGHYDNPNWICLNFEPCV